MKIKFCSLSTLCAGIVIMAGMITSGCQKEEQTASEAQLDNQLKASKTVTTASALADAVKAAKGGDVITISGTIKLTSTLKCSNSGTANAKITLTGGILDCSGLSSGSRGVDVQGSYWNITNLTIKNAPDNGLLLQKGGNNYIYKVISYGNGDSGFQIYNSGHDNTISNCQSYDNYDSANGGENADGFACKLSAGKNNKFEGCTATHNSDDGWDLYDQPYTVVINKCTATKNGYGTNGDGNGFKLGSKGQTVAHTVTNCTATNNKGYGYTGNGNKGHITTTGSTGSGNSKGLWDRIY